MSSRDTLRIILLTLCIGLGASLRAQPVVCDKDPLSVPKIEASRLPERPASGQG